MTFPALLQPGTPALCYLASLAPGSRPAQVSALRCLADRLSRPTSTQIGSNSNQIGLDQGWTNLPWHMLDRVRTMALRAWLVEHYAPATVNRHLSALRGVLRESWRAGLMSDAEYHRASDLPAVKSTTLPAGRCLGSGDLSKLWTAVGSRKHPRRSRAILALLMGSGLRRSEVASLEYRNVNFETGEIAIRRSKGGKDRIAWIGPSWLWILQEWRLKDGRYIVESHSNNHVDSNSGLGSNNSDYRMCSSEVRKKTGQDREGSKRGRAGVNASLFRLTPGSIYKIVVSAGLKAGLGRVTPHDLRRTFVTQLLECGADLSIVKELAGHSNVSTTTRYDRRGEQAKQAAVALLEVPR